MPGRAKARPFNWRAVVLLQEPERRLLRDEGRVLLQALGHGPERRLLRDEGRALLRVLEQWLERRLLRDKGRGLARDTSHISERCQGRHDARTGCGKRQIPNLKPQTPNPRHQGRAGHDRMVGLVETMMTADGLRLTACG